MPPASEKFYADLVAKRGVDAATDFSEDGQNIRFDIIHRLLRPPCLRLLDYGCNVGDFYDYLKTRNYAGSYTGVDAYEPFVTRLLKKNIGDEKFQGWCGNVMDDDLVNRGQYIDYVVASGVFCHSDQQYQHAEMLERLWSACQRGLIVNFLSEFSPIKPRKSMLCRYHPSYAVILAERFKCHDFQLIQGYHAKNDFTLALYK